MSFLQGLRGPPDIERLKANGDVKGLIKALSYRSNATIREDAAQTLLEMGKRKDALNVLCEMNDARAVEPLVVLLNSTDEIAEFITISNKLDTLHWQPDRSEAGARYWMAKGRWDKVAEVGAPAVELLIAALRSKDASVCAAAARALGEIGDTRAVEPLTARVGYRDENTRNAVFKALDNLGWQPDRSEAGACYWMAKGRWDKVTEVGAPAVELLIDALGSKDASVRVAAARALGEIGDTRAVEPLTARVGYRDEDTRDAAFEALDKLGCQPGRSEAGARYWKAKGRWDKVAEVGAPAVELLITALGSTDASVRAAATEALRQIGDPAVKSLIAHLMKGKTVAALALGEIGDARAVGPLVMALTLGPKHLRGPAATALGQIGDTRAVEPLIAVVKTELNVLFSTTGGAAAKALGELGDARAVEPLIAALRHSSMNSNAAKALGQFGDTRAVEPLIAALKRSLHTGELVGSYAATALGQIGDTRAVEPLIEVLKERKRTATLWAAAGALKALTGQDFGTDDARWQLWWEEHKGESQEKQG